MQNANIYGLPKQGLKITLKYNLMNVTRGKQAVKKLSFF